MPAAPAVLVNDIEGVRTLTLNRPESFNSLTTELKVMLLTEVRRAAADGTVRAVVLTGAGKAFCAGQDLREHAALLDGCDPDALHTVAETADHREGVAAFVGKRTPVFTGR